MKNISYLDWRTYFNPQTIYSVGEDLILLDNQLMESPRYPFKTDMLTATICIKGQAEGSANLQKIITQPNSFNVILPGQIITHNYQTTDFEARHIIMSSKFVDTLGLDNRFSIFNTHNQVISTILSDYELEAILTFYEMLKWNITHKNDYILETVRHMTLAFFYGFSHTFQQNITPKQINRRQQLSDDFLSLVKQHFKQEHSLEFYANKLCVTPKHLTTTIKATTDCTAKEWIDKHLLLEAKALLKSTNLTIQQIADTLHFTSQDVFSKYFKHHIGRTPKEYRGLL
ncbi:MAG: helix-turn-helix transcriptional regulator [Paludibacteraceae bacterium]|nr:helix-turn-helix transcriptional regulator [Paludibacteraceae bacterium]